MVSWTAGSVIESRVLLTTLVGSGVPFQCSFVPLMKLAPSTSSTKLPALPARSASSAGAVG
jgi:hypothetical protein